MLLPIRKKKRRKKKEAGFPQREISGQRPMRHLHEGEGGKKKKGGEGPAESGRLLPNANHGCFFIKCRKKKKESRFPQRHFPARGEEKGILGQKGTNIETLALRTEGEERRGKNGRRHPHIYTRETLSAGRAPRCGGKGKEKRDLLRSQNLVQGISLAPRPDGLKPMGKKKGKKRKKPLPGMRKK